MASSEPQPSEVNEDQEAKDLFNAFMDITKDAAMMDDDQKSVAKMENKEIGIKTEERMEIVDGNSLETEEHSNENADKIKNGKEFSLSDKEPVGEDKSNVSKSLSNAVNELSDLEQQLSLMISEGSKNCPQQDSILSTTGVDGSDNVSVKDTNEGENTESQSQHGLHNSKESAVTASEGTATVTEVADSKGNNTEGENTESQSQHGLHNSKESAVTASEGTATVTEVVDSKRNNTEGENTESQSQDGLHNSKESAVTASEGTATVAEVADSKGNNTEEKSPPQVAAEDAERNGDTDVIRELKTDDVIVTGTEGNCANNEANGSTGVTIQIDEKTAIGDAIHAPECANELPQQPELSAGGVVENSDVIDEKLQEDAQSSGNEPTSNGSCDDSQKHGDQEDSSQKNADVLENTDKSSDSSVQEGVKHDEGVNEKPDSTTEEGSKECRPEVQNDNPNSSVQEGVKHDEGVNEKSDPTTEEESKESRPEVQNDNPIRNSSATDIEILMTDESGISERKSLDSLDSLDEKNHSRPHSPVLSDEGIDSDSKSDIVDDDAFDTSSSDFSVKSKSSFLDVDRNRTESDSSTISEQEFKRDISDKTDGLCRDDVDQISMQGYLLKLGGSGFTPRNWRKRWFVLKGDNCLYYYKHMKEKVPCGVIVLCNYSVTKAPESSRKFCFKLNKGGARSYHLCASSDDEMRKWMVPLMAAASEIAPDGSSFQISEGNVHNVSIPALSIKDPECHGYLSKQGHNIKNWKRRYCVLKNGYLYYYSDMSNTTALGVAKLIGYSIKLGEKRGKHYCFYGSPPDETLRTYHFAAETENDRERWMTRMVESIHKGNMSNNIPESP